MNKQASGDIFQDDALYREQFIDEIFNTCCSTLLKRGGVLAVNAPFGYGKSKFAQYYEQYLNKEDSPNKAIIIDAFLYDYINDPFIAIHKSIGELVCYDGEMHKLGREILKASAQEIFDIVPILRKSNLSNKLLEPNLEQTIKKYINKLEELAKSKPITIIIDELDRCRPDYAVHFLERVKHYFGPVPNILFILMINKDQLFKSIGHVYGIKDKNDITNYFEKFLSYRIIELPTLSKQELIQGQSVDKESSYAYKMLYSKFIAKKEGYNNNEEAHERFIETAAAFLYALDLNYRYHDQVYLGIEIALSIKTTQEPLFSEDTARLYAYLFVLSLGEPSIFKMLKERQSRGHELAHDLLINIESKFYEYGNHVVANNEYGKIDGGDTRGFFNFFKSIHYLAIENNKEEKTNQRNKIIDSLENQKETKNYGLCNVIQDPQKIRSRFAVFMQNIL